MNRRKKLQTVGGHLLIWVLNYLLFAFTLGLDWSGFSNQPDSDYNTLAYAYTYGVFLNAVLFYAQAFWLVPKFYMRNRKARYYVLAISITMVVSLLEAYLDYVLYDIFAIEATDTFLDNFGLIVAVNLFYVIAGFYYIFRLEHKKSEKVRQSLLEESYKAELKYLKAQISPHFLFNGINSVYHLIDKDSVLAKETLLQFSELLRYQLYESETSILLEKELNYVSHYINIEKTRRGSDIQLNYDIEFENPSIKMAPLLLIPFIENAFKHCSSQKDENRIDIRVIEAGGMLTLNTTNSFDELIPKKEPSGIGLVNVKKRLALLYPDDYQLEIRKDNGLFNVLLSINLRQ